MRALIFVTAIMVIEAAFVVRDDYVEAISTLREGKSQCDFNSYCFSDGTTGLYYLRDTFRFNCDFNRLIVTHLTDGFFVDVNSDNPCPINGFINLYHHNSDAAWPPSHLLIAATGNSSAYDFYCFFDKLYSRYAQVDRCTDSVNNWISLDKIANYSSRYNLDCTEQVSVMRIESFALQIAVTCNDDGTTYAWKCISGNVYTECSSNIVCSEWSYADGDLLIPFNSSCSWHPSTTTVLGSTTDGLSNNDDNITVNNYLSISLFSAFDDSSLIAKLFVALTAVSIFVTIMAVTFAFLRRCNGEY